MGIKGVCDVCGNEIRPTQLGAPSEWASISVTFPTRPVSGKREARLTQLPPGPPDYYLICSGACVEKALYEVKAQLVKAFEAKREYQED
jgi:hypothetical protein